jgi:hypothetical protein
MRVLKREKIGRFDLRLVEQKLRIGHHGPPTIEVLNHRYFRVVVTDRAPNVIVMDYLGPNSEVAAATIARNINYAKREAAEAT